MEQQDKRTDEQTNGSGREEQRSAPTQVGQILVQGLSRITRPLASPAPNRREIAHATSRAQRERIATLVAALGDSSHPLHHQAVNDLVAIGEPAVPALNDALDPRHPWLKAYRAAEALGQIGDGRAAGPLLEALRHPNSNVRWGAVRALAVVGDARALIELRRVAREDHGKTSWGESVAGAARSALNQMRSQHMLLRSADLIKTAIACVLMLVSLILAWSVITSLRDELRQFGRAPVELDTTQLVRTPLPTADLALAPDEQEVAEPTVAPEPSPTPVPAIGGTALATGNVRAQPVRNRTNVIGGITEGDEIIFLAATPDRQWYRVRLGERHAASSRIDSPDGTGWVSQSLLSQPQGELPVEESQVATPTP